MISDMTPCHEFPQRLNSNKFVSWPKLSGTIPLNLLKDKSSILKLDKFPRDIGIGPEKEFLDNSSNSRHWKNPRALGKIPSSLLSVKSNPKKLLLLQSDKASMNSFISPIIELNDRSNFCKLQRFPRATRGMLPLSSQI